MAAKYVYNSKHVVLSIAEFQYTFELFNRKKCDFYILVF